MSSASQQFSTPHCPPVSPTLSQAYLQDAAQEDVKTKVLSRCTSATSELLRQSSSAPMKGRSTHCSSPHSSRLWHHKGHQAAPPWRTGWGGKTNSQDQKIPSRHPNILEPVGGRNSTSAESWRSWHGVVVTKALALVEPRTTGLGHPSGGPSSPQAAGYIDTFITTIFFSTLVLRHTVQLFHCHKTTPLTSRCWHNVLANAAAPPGTDSSGCNKHRALGCFGCSLSTDLRAWWKAPCRACIVSCTRQSAAHLSSLQASGLWSCAVFLGSLSPRTPEHIELFPGNSQLAECQTQQRKKERKRQRPWLCTEALRKASAGERNLLQQVN